MIAVGQGARCHRHSTTSPALAGLFHTVAMMPWIYKLDELDVEESFCPDTHLSAM